MPLREAPRAAQKMSVAHLRLSDALGADSALGSVEGETMLSNETNFDL